MQSDLDRARRIVPHWIEHNAEHAQEFREWAERVRVSGAVAAADHILQAAAAMEQSNEHLSSAVGAIGDE